VTDIRSEVESYLDAIGADPEKIQKLREMLDLALGQTKGVWILVTCKHCNRQGKYFEQIPVPAKAADVLVKLIEATKGKVPEQVTVRHEFDTLHVQELPTEELHRLAERVVDGEFEEVTLSLPTGEN